MLFCRSSRTCSRHWRPRDEYYATWIWRSSTWASILNFANYFTCLLLFSFFVITIKSFVFNFVFIFKKYIFLQNKNTFMILLVINFEKQLIDATEKASGREKGPSIGSTWNQFEGIIFV